MTRLAALASQVRAPASVEGSERAGDGSRARVDAELRVDVLQVLAHSVRGDDEQLGDLLVRLTSRHPLEDLALACRQAVRPVRAARLA